MKDIQVVVDGGDRIVQVTGGDREGISRFLGHSVWQYCPGAEPVFGPSFDEARRSGDVVESTVFYGGGTVDLRVDPSGASLAVTVTRRTELDVRTLATLAQSLRTIEAELAAREPARRDRPAPVSPQALP